MQRGCGDEIILRRCGLRSSLLQPKIEFSFPPSMLAWMGGAICIVIVCYMYCDSKSVTTPTWQVPTGSSNCHHTQPLRFSLSSVRRHLLGGGSVQSVWRYTPIQNEPHIGNKAFTLLPSCSEAAEIKSFWEGVAYAPSAWNWVFVSTSYAGLDGPSPLNIIFVVWTETTPRNMSSWPSLYCS